MANYDYTNDIETINRDIQIVLERRLPYQWFKSKMSRVNVLFTHEQDEQIQANLSSNNIEAAYVIIATVLNREFEGVNTWRLTVNN